MQKTALSPLATRLLTGGAVGTVGGAALGAYRANPNDRARGAFRGALGGLAAGTAAGGAYHLARGGAATRPGTISSAAQGPRSGTMPTANYTTQAKAEAAKFQGPDPGTAGVYQTAQGHRASIRDQVVDRVGDEQSTGRGVLGNMLYRYSTPEIQQNIARARQLHGIERHSVADADWMDALAHGLASKGIGAPTQQDINAVLGSPEFQATLRHIKTGAWRRAKLAQLTLAQAYGLVF